MPSMRASLVDLSPDRYHRIEPAEPTIAKPIPAPELPIVIRRSPVMISSLPSIATDVDGIARQFYGGPHVPTRRLILP
jgi:hypothetical protein